MARTRSAGRLKSNFTFGGSVAESDPLLVDAFYDNGDYTAVSDFTDPRNFLIGRTGSGKSALLTYLEDQYPGKVARVVPEDLSLPYVANLPAVRNLRDLGVHLEIFFRALWKHVIIVEVIRHRYKVTTPEGKASLFESLRDRFRRDPGKREALEYLDAFGERFWCSADERVHDIAEKFQRRVDASAQLSAGLPGTPSLGAGTEVLESIEVRKQLQERYQLVVNETQPAKLNRMIRILGEEILESPHHQLYLVIDDLDRDWVDEGIANELIRCLLHAVVDMQSVKNLKVLVALRTNIFRQLLQDGHRRGGQEEKLRGLALDIRWTRGDLTGLLDARTSVALARNGLTQRRLAEMLPGGPRDKRPADYILDRTLMRPRDAIVYLNMAARASTGKSQLTWDAIHSVEREYSQNRLDALRDEWKDPYGGLERVAECFRKAPTRMDRLELGKRFDEAALLSLDESFLGKQWLSGLVLDRLEGDEDVAWHLAYGALVRLMYSVGFLGMGNARSRRANYAYDDAQWCEHVDNLGGDCFGEIHSTYRAALEIRDRQPELEPL